MGLILRVVYQSPL